MLHSKIDKPEVTAELEYINPKTDQSKRIGIESKGGPSRMGYPALPNGVNPNQQHARAIADLVDQVT